MLKLPVRLVLFTSLVAFGLAGCHRKAKTFSISGTVSGATASGVTIALSGNATASTTTDASGNYTFSGLANGTYILTPSKSGYSFTPTSLSVAVNKANVVGQNFTAAALTYSVSGHISGASSVVVNLSGASTGQVTTDGSGNYSFSGLVNGSYTITPALSGYVFSPVSITVPVNDASVTGQDFAASPSYSISGSINGAATSGVTLSLSGSGVSTTATSDSSGNYSFPNLVNGSYTITASLAGYVFSPVSLVVTVNGAAVTGQSFTATANSGPTYSISGTVSGLKTNGVTITLSGANTGTVITDASGNYSFAGLVNGSYTVTPSVSGGYIFAPASLPETLAGANLTGQNFNDTGAYSISGTVTGLAVSGVTITLSGGSTASTTTGPSGTYTIGNLPNGQYTITPSLTGYAFTPASHSATVTDANLTAQDFVDTGAFSISGTITGSAVSGVSIAVTGAMTASATSGSSGTFSVSGLTSGSYTVTPSLSGYVFAPASRSLTIGSTSVSGQDFASSVAPLGSGTTVSGTVSYSGTATGRLYLSLVDSSCTGCSPRNGTSLAWTGQGSASYTIRGVNSGTYTINAFIDTLGTQTKVSAFDPNGSSSSFTVTAGTNVTGTNVSLTDPPPAVPAAPTLSSVSLTTDAALLFWNGGTGDHFKVYYTVASGSCPTTTTLYSSSKTVVSSNNGVNALIRPLTSGSTYCFMVTGMVSGIESAPSVPLGPMPASPPTGGTTVTVPVSLGFTATGPLYVALAAGGPCSGGPSAIYFNDVASPTASQNVVVSGVPAGTYQLYYWIDMTNAGTFVPATIGDIRTNKVQQVTVGTSPVTIPAVNLPGGDEQVAVLTQSSGPSGVADQRNLNFQVTPNQKIPVLVTISSGPHLPSVIDIGLDSNNGGSYRASIGLGTTRPTVGDTYGLSITNSDGSTSSLSAAVTGVIDNVAVLTAPANNATGVAHTANQPTFSWTAPTSVPSGATQQISVRPSGRGDSIWSYSMGSTTSTIAYNADGSACQTTLNASTTYQWEVDVVDSAGNTGQSSQFNFTTGP